MLTFLQGLFNSIKITLLKEQVDNRIYIKRALDVEYKSKGIIVQSLCPYFVSTKLSAVRRSLTAPKPDEFVSSALKTIGSQSVTNGCLIHNIQVN